MFGNDNGTTDYLVPSSFNMDWMDYTAADGETYYCIEIPGYTFGAHWNGWATPYFTKEQTDAYIALVRKYPQYFPIAEYDEALDAYRVQDADSEPDVFGGTDMKLEDGSTIRVYAIGTYNYTWNERNNHYGVGMGGVHECFTCKRLATKVNDDGVCYECAQVPESITLEGEDSWKCVCGNSPDSNGFYPCDASGHQVEPVLNGAWDSKLYVCDACGRIIDQETLKVVGRVTCGKCGKFAPFLNDFGMCPDCEADAKAIAKSDKLFTCECGNTAIIAGFFPVNADGKRVDMAHGESYDGKLVVCGACGRITDRVTGTPATIATVPAVVVPDDVNNVSVAINTIAEMMPAHADGGAQLDWAALGDENERKLSQMVVTVASEETTWNALLDTLSNDARRRHPDLYEDTQGDAAFINTTLERMHATAFNGQIIDCGDQALLELATHLRSLQESIRCMLEYSLG